MKNEIQFKRTLRRASTLAFITGKISLGDRLAVMSVLTNSKRTTPDGVEVDLLEEIAKDTLETLQDNQKVGATETVDSLNWDAILNFIKEYMPTIIEFVNLILSLFKKTDEQPTT